MITSSSKDKKTVGEHSYELQQKEDEKINPVDLQREIHQGNTDEDSFENQIRLAVKRGDNEEDFIGDFFVVVLFKKERLLQNVVRQYFFPRQTCPPPDFDQVVYHYHRFAQKLEFLWVIPDKNTCIELPLIKNQLPHEQQQLLGFIHDFRTGKLDKVCEKLNKSPLKNLIVDLN